MTLDHTTGVVHWVPTNAQALNHQQNFSLRARNGAGEATQNVSLQVVNVNDPPTPFDLGMPASGGIISYFGRDPEITLRWEQSTDPDGDSIRYTVEIDSTSAFGSPAQKTIDAGSADSVRVSFPRFTQNYYWRVSASDGRFTTHGTPSMAMISIAVTTPLASSPKVNHDPPVSLPEPVNTPILAPSTSVSYTVNHAGQVRIVVFNILGQEVLRVFDGMQPEGSYQLDLAKLSLPNGMYFYRLQAPGIFETKKMVLAR
jgi:hypothetical protein